MCHCVINEMAQVPKKDTLASRRAWLERCDPGGPCLMLEAALAYPSPCWEAAKNLPWRTPRNAGSCEKLQVGRLALTPARSPVGCQALQLTGPPDLVAAQILLHRAAPLDVAPAPRYQSSEGVQIKCWRQASGQGTSPAGQNSSRHMICRRWRE